MDFPITDTVGHIFEAHLASEWFIRNPCVVSYSKYLYLCGLQDLYICTYCTNFAGLLPYFSIAAAIHYSKPFL